VSSASRSLKFGLPGLQRQLRHLHVVRRRAHRPRRQAQPVRVQRQPVAEVRLALQPPQQIHPVLLLRVVRDQLLHRPHIRVGVVHALRRVGQQLQPVLGRRLPRLLRRGDLHLQLARRPREVTPEVLRLDQQRADLPARAAFLEVALAPLHRLRVVLAPVRRARQRLQHAQLVRLRQLARGRQRLERFAGRLRIARPGGRRDAHALDRVVLARVAVRHRVRLAHLGQGFLVLARLDQVARRLQRAAHVRAHAVLRLCAQCSAQHQGGHQGFQLA